MACGCPVVTTEVGAVAEYAVHRRAALIVPPGDVAAMANGLEEVLSNPALAARLSEHGVATASRYTLSRTAPSFAEALARAISASV